MVFEIFCTVVHNYMHLVKTLFNILVIEGDYCTLQKIKGSHSIVEEGAVGVGDPLILGTADERWSTSILSGFEKSIHFSIGNYNAKPILAFLCLIIFTFHQSCYI